MTSTPSASHRYRLPLDNCVGQAYDDASNISALIDTCSYTQIRNMMGTIRQIIKCFKDSLKRMATLRSEIIKNEGDYIQLSEKNRIISLCNTRWVDRNTSTETFLELYLPTINTLDR
ncbi:unnamed protein product [Didymodactylos carnosus]|uniref:Uncharacterized protein n=1 Tax=Didymodactylos carnosus TaxID=1234261 RepID=A0A815E6A1_9BILA|nr:unnamed protein product [Didymodactylos carnosus]CAF4147390.1 unnamed protein product [Didymodactylos carnosus]